jgi:hypothetical protein
MTFQLFSLHEFQVDCYVVAKDQLQGQKCTVIAEDKVPTEKYNLVVVDSSGPISNRAWASLAPGAFLIDWPSKQGLSYQVPEGMSLICETGVADGGKVCFYRKVHISCQHWVEFGSIFVI